MDRLGCFACLRDQGEVDGKGFEEKPTRKVGNLVKKINLFPLHEGKKSADRGETFGERIYLGKGSMEESNSVGGVNRIHFPKMNSMGGNTFRKRVLRGY